MLNFDVNWSTCEMVVTCDLLCWITTILACMLVCLKSLVISLDYRSYMGSSARIWSLRWLFLYLCSYNLDGSVTFIAPRSWYPTSCLGARVLLYVAPFWCLVFCRDVCIGRSRPPMWRTDWGRKKLLLLIVLLVLVSLYDDWIESHKPWCLLRMS
jgi:hypothetical protein